MSTLVVSAVNNSSGNSLLPLPGTVIFFASTTTPSGWIKCNGASLNTTTYAALFAITGYTFGGSGASFNVPDLRGEFVRGWDDARGIDSGRAFGGAQNATQIGGSTSFSHSVRLADADPDTNTNQVLYQITNNATTNRPNYRVRPRNIALLACIKF